MQSYYAMLSSRLAVGEELPKNYRPTFRSSAIFPALHNEHVSSRILFMGYWLLKRNILEIGLLINLRSNDGGLISRQYRKIDSSKAFRIEVIDLLQGVGKMGSDFIGSIELEIFSSVDLVYPYPAFVVNYYNDEFCTAVHSVGRVYNDLEDFQGNDEYKVKESGFDIYSSDEITGFFSFVNGPLELKSHEINFEVQNQQNEILTGSFTLEATKAFETKFIAFNSVIENLSFFLGNQAGTIKIGHRFDSFFPRFLAGNQNLKTHSISITHSYYDSSKITDEKAYWNRLDNNFIDSSTAIPVYSSNNLTTSLAVYPIFSPSAFSVSLRFFDEQANEVGYLEKVLTIDGKRQDYVLLCINDAILKHQLPLKQIVLARIECNWEDKQKIPTRTKFGLNVGYKDELPCNICFAPQIGNPNILLKKGTFKWSPILNHTNSEIKITNSSSLINYKADAPIEIKYYRESDNQIIERSAKLPSFGLLTINLNEDPELTEFYRNQTGWVTFTSSNPNINGWYFDFTSSKIVAADHIF